MIPDYKLKSQVCITPGTCYPVDTTIPAWMILILAGSSVLLLEKIYQLLNS